MSGKLEAACLAIGVVLRTVTGIRQVHDYAPDNPNAYPTAIIYPALGSMGNYAIGLSRGLHDITIDVLEPQQQQTLPRFMADFIPFVDLVTGALLAQMASTGGRFTATIDTFDRVDYTFIGRVDYAADPMRGYRFVMRQVKILT